MYRRERACLVAVIAVLSTAMSACDVFAQSYPSPSRPIRMVIPYSPGGATDVPGRLIAAKLSDAFGHQVIVDNRPGAGSAIGSEIVVRAQPDGYTLLLTGTPFAVIPALYSKLPFDPVRDFAPVMQVALAPNVLVVHPSLPAQGDAFVCFALLHHGENKSHAYPVQGQRAIGCRLAGQSR